MSDFQYDARTKRYRVTLDFSADELRAIAAALGPRDGASRELTELADLLDVYNCRGDRHCPSEYHEHGCYADVDGSSCNLPEEHR